MGSGQLVVHHTGPTQGLDIKEEPPGLVEGLSLGSEAISPLLLPDHRNSAVISYLIPMQETLDKSLPLCGPQLPHQVNQGYELHLN